MPSVGDLVVGKEHNVSGLDCLPIPGVVGLVIRVWEEGDRYFAEILCDGRRYVYPMTVLQTLSPAEGT